MILILSWASNGFRRSKPVLAPNVTAFLTISFQHFFSKFRLFSFIVHHRGRKHTCFHSCYTQIKSIHSDILCKRLFITIIVLTLFAMSKSDESLLAVYEGNMYRRIFGYGNGGADSMMSYPRCTAIWLCCNISRMPDSGWLAMLCKRTKHSVKAVLKDRGDVVVPI